MSKFKVETLIAGKDRKSTSSNWKGGENINSKGYILIYCPEHPNHNKQGYVMKHRFVMEVYLGRFLKKKEVVHHIDGDKSNNKLSNLRLYSSDIEHLQSESHKYNSFVWKNREKEYYKDYYLKNTKKIGSKNYKKTIC